MLALKAILSTSQHSNCSVELGSVSTSRMDDIILLFEAIQSINIHKIHICGAMS